MASDQEKEPSGHDDHLEGGDLASVEDPAEIPVDNKLGNLMMTEEDERDFETFALASLNVSKRKTSWRASQDKQNFILRPSRFIIRTILLLARLGP